MRQLSPSNTILPSRGTATLDPLPAAHPEPAPSFVERLNREPRPTTPPDPFGIAADTLAGVRLFESRRDRVMAIGFDEKPSPAVLDRLKDAGYRWNPREKVWVMPVRPESARTTRIEAERLYQEVSGLIRSEKGVETGQEVPFRRAGFGELARNFPPDVPDSHPCRTGAVRGTV